MNRTCSLRAALPALALITSFARVAPAEDVTPTEVAAVPAATAPPPPAPAAAPAEPALGKLTLGGYVEAFYAYNFNRPSNGITNFRGFDNRHNSFTLANAAVDAQWEKSNVSGRVTLQIGHTPNTYYLAEPSSPGAGGAASADAATWKYLQQAYVGYKLPNVGKGLLLQAGLFTSPIGVEVVPIKDNWNWSRSNLFFALPFYHSGARATQTLTDTWSVTGAIYNGWNSVVDNNNPKSVSAQLQYTDSERLLFSALYFGGIERNKSSPEGKPWRHDFDAWAQVKVVDPLWLGVHGNAGFENTRFGTSYWAAGALYGRVRLLSWLHVAGRGDYFKESVGENVSGRASPIFWPADWVASATGTLDLHPGENISVRVEYRHDAAENVMFFGRGVAGDGSVSSPFQPNAKTQDTVTLGATTWL
ncbi:MAG: outer membrane protein [Myxococcaceae bacterium]|nr:outer membrane protein [Myxococcaceae bacterium]